MPISSLLPEKDGRIRRWWPINCRELLECAWLWIFSLVFLVREKLCTPAELKRHSQAPPSSNGTCSSHGKTEVEVTHYEGQRPGLGSLASVYNFHFISSYCFSCTHWVLEILPALFHLICLKVTEGNYYLLFCMRNLRTWKLLGSGYLRRRRSPDVPHFVAAQVPLPTSSAPNCPPQSPHLTDPDSRRLEEDVVWLMPRKGNHTHCLWIQRVPSVFFFLAFNLQVSCIISHYQKNKLTQDFWYAVACRDRERNTENR